ncbi:MAG: imidazolonepropionase [bacterium]|nr:imidazolonepropionase [bacterium]
MTDVDLVVVNIAQLATPLGSTALTGADHGKLRVIEDAAIAVQGDEIVFVGPREALAASVLVGPETVHVDAGGGTALPGWVDAHTHLPFSGWREKEFDERLRGATYSDIAARGGGILSTVRRTREASLPELRRHVRERLDHLLELGTTTVEAKSGYGLSPRDEVKQLEALREAAQDHPADVVPTFLGAHTVPIEHRENREGYVRLLIDEMLPEVAANKMAEYADAFIDANAFSADEARRVLGRARELDLGVRVHADQLADDGAALVAAELGAASADHLEFASPEGIEAMARAGTCGVLLPAATFFLMMDARPPGRRLIDAGVPVVVATDFNPGSCPTDSMALSICFACLTAGLSVDEAIAGATLNAAHSLGRADRTGSLELGKRADIAIHAMPNRYHLVYRMGQTRVDTVIAGGKLIRPNA